MTPILELILLTGIAGAAIPLGGLLASFEHIRSDWLRSEVRHTVIAFGGGALISAVALVLVPEGTARLSTGASVTAFAAGGIGFWLLQTLLDRSRSSASQCVAMLSDFVPEVIALGATIASGGTGAVLLASIIALQNVPEGFNAYRELRDGGLARKPILALFTACAIAGPLLGALGYAVLADHTVLLGWMQVSAAAGILYLVFEDVAPQAKLENSALPPLGAVLGFMLGLLGSLLEG